MPLTESNMVELGARAPDFSLPNTNPNVDASNVALSDFAGSGGTVVAFICNHCPYVVHIKDAFAQFARDYSERGLSVIAISANDISTHPQDGPEAMGEDAVKHGYGFPYLYDEAQDVAKSYDAACTPDIYLFDAERKLAYRGQFDSSRPGNGIPVTGKDLRDASDAVLAGVTVSAEQNPSVGCNIKWKGGNA